MAYAELASLAPQFGFYAVIGALVVYSLVGTSRHLGVGPEPGTAILAATGVSSIAAGDPDRYIALMTGLALVVSGICVAGAVARLGVLASVLSKPVLVGWDFRRIRLLGVATVCRHRRPGRWTTQSAVRTAR